MFLGTKDNPLTISSKLQCDEVNDYVYSISRPRHTQNASVKFVYKNINEKQLTKLENLPKKFKLK
jgi:hypothetical protein